MSDSKNTVLIVDDLSEDIEFVIESLKDDYAILVATNGKDALKIAQGTTRPDIILMDVVMPEMNGYETCQAIKSIPELEDIDVIFISSHESIEDIISGYESGGSDYIIKPFNPEELKQKLFISIKNKANQEQLQREKDMAMSTAMTAMSSSGELGIIMEFYRQSFNVTGIDELGQLITDSILEGFGMRSTLQIRSMEDIYNFSSNGSTKPLEEELLFRLKDSGRINEVKTRLILNYGDISMLIKNLPDNQEIRGRIRDNIAMLLEGAERRLHVNEIQKGKIQQVIKESNNVLFELNNEHKQQKETSLAIIDEILISLNEAVTQINLSEEEESSLYEIINTGTDKLQDTLDQGKKTDQTFQQVIEKLRSIWFMTEQ